MVDARVGIVPVIGTYSFRSADFQGDSYICRFVSNTHHFNFKHTWMGEHVVWLVELLCSLWIAHIYWIIISNMRMMCNVESCNC